LLSHYIFQCNAYTSNLLTNSTLHQQIHNRECCYVRICFDPFSRCITVTLCHCQIIIRTKSLVKQKYAHLLSHYIFQCNAYTSNLLTNSTLHQQIHNRECCYVRICVDPFSRCITVILCHCQIIIRTKSLVKQKYAHLLSHYIFQCNAHTSNLLTNSTQHQQIHNRECCYVRICFDPLLGCITVTLLSATMMVICRVNFSRNSENILTRQKRCVVPVSLRAQITDYRIPALLTKIKQDMSKWRCDG